MLEHRTQRSAETAVLMPSLEGFFEQQHNHHAEGVKRRATSLDKISAPTNAFDMPWNSIFLEVMF